LEAASGAIETVVCAPAQIEETRRHADNNDFNLIENSALQE